MNILAINGSPRKHANTATLLEHALQGAVEAVPDGIEVRTTLIHLYDLRFTGCRSCFACKRLGGASYGRCAARDDISPVLEDAARCDVLILGSPLYLGNVSGEMRSFLERLIYPYLVYDRNHSSLAPRRMPTAFLYTMNVGEAMFHQIGYEATLAAIHNFVGRTFTPPLSYCATDTCQFDDYSQYMCETFDGEAKKRHHEEQFPKDCEAARAIGAKLAAQACGLNPGGTA